MEKDIEKFLANYDCESARFILRYFNSINCLDITLVLGRYFIKLFPFSAELLSDYSLICYMANRHEEFYEICDLILSLRNHTEESTKTVLFNQHFAIDHIKHRFTDYNKEHVEKVLIDPDTLVTFTVTTCKRLDLFQKTMNSFLACCSDLHRIGKWLCVDDNSSQEDREKMQQLYPFFTFYWKRPEEKGHSRSMNIIREIVDTPFVFHIEDDWMFYSKRPYITECIEVLSQDSKIGQCLINKNFSETERDISIQGGEFRTTRSGLRYYIHEYASTDEERELWYNKHGTESIHCNYWPHFSFRPSLLKTSVYKKVGGFSETAPHFEMEYAYRYTGLGFVSAFLEGQYSEHIGRLTSERFDSTIQNAYTLNDVNQFSENASIPEPLDCKTYVINLDRRPDRMSEFDKVAQGNIKKWERFSAIDGWKLDKSEQLHLIFEGNNYNMRKGIVGCALSHIQLYIEILKGTSDIVCVLEDDVTFVPNFGNKVRKVLEDVSQKDWDMIYLGHHIYEKYQTKITYNNTKFPILEKWDTNKSLKRSMGGTGGYLINKKGAERLLSFIDNRGMTNGIDTVQQKACDTLNIFYLDTHLIYSECFRGSNVVDSDIQFSKESLSLTDDERINSLKTLYTFIDYVDSAEDGLKTSGQRPWFYALKPDEEKPELDLYHYYIGNTLFCDPKGPMYDKRLRKHGVFDISDCLEVSSLEVYTDHTQSPLP